LSRATDIHDLKGYLLEVVNGMREYMYDLPSYPEAVGEESTFFLLAGYSWRRSRFVIWTLHFDRSIQAFTFRRANWWRGGDPTKKLAMVGDAVDEAKTRLVEILRHSGRLKAGGFDLEPLAALRDIIREGKHDSVGGPPQVVKIYRHMNVTPFGVYWPNRASNQMTMLGRPLLHYEASFFPMLDPDTLGVV